MKKKRSDIDWEEDPPFMPDLTVYEKGRGLQHPIGYVRFDPPKTKKTKPRLAKPIKAKPRKKKNARR